MAMAALAQGFFETYNNTSDTSAGNTFDTIGTASSVSGIWARPTINVTAGQTAFVVAGTGRDYWITHPLGTTTFATVTGTVDTSGIGSVY